MISKSEVKHLAELSRIELTDEEEERLAHDLGKILDHFAELKEVDTEKVSPLTGGALIMNALRDDSDSRGRIENDMAVEEFPDKAGGLLKVPPVFS
ncbi:MAG: Asp-tRNA(Asn)/Glu-tRNA(Gln) amidotransferase subunit GatC [bacterium]